MIPECVMDDICHAEEEKYYVKRFLNYVYGAHAFENKEVVKMDIKDKNTRRREIMNRFKIGDVVCVEDYRFRGMRLKIFGFDYAHYRVGCSFEYKGPGYQKIIRNWVDPLTIIAKTNSNAMMEHMTCGVPTPKKVIYDEAAGVTVVLWTDGTKTIVRAVEGEEHDAYRGYCVALAKKIHGTNSALKRDLEKVLVVKEDKK